MTRIYSITNAVHIVNIQNKPFSANYIPIFFNDTATTEIYTLSLHDALPIYFEHHPRSRAHSKLATCPHFVQASLERDGIARSEEHTSELQPQSNIVCRL